MSLQEDELEKEQKRSCSGLKEELMSCLHKSDCMVKDGKTMKECMDKEIAGVDTDCRQIQFAFFECRRSMLDMRTRFRGKKGY